MVQHLQLQSVQGGNVRAGQCDHNPRPSPCQREPVDSWSRVSSWCLHIISTQAHVPYRIPTHIMMCSLSPPEVCSGAPGTLSFCSQTCRCTEAQSTLVTLSAPWPMPRTVTVTGCRGSAFYLASSPPFSESGQEWLS